MRVKQWWTVALGLLLTFALAQTRGDIRLDLKAYRVLSVQEQGRTVERLEAALDAKPGQIIEYQLTAQNTTDNPLRLVALVVPIPASTAYQAMSAEPFRLGETLVIPEFSFDGGRTYGKPPLKRKVRVTENGKEVEKEVEVKPEEYTHARWVLPELGAKQSVLLKLRTVVR
ncbi:hypothetical protein [Meiothermus sp.]|uniref:hypothetical protein n=1 Tax=Meiothermus sp. TaxID=1955249 RepID=UPI0021DEFB7C|nr:hypothetical protein [Meiothermus sp.]GIW33196.1 MAG: hypothetical protein KatS3mg072_0529 [Meiothermus sp.]